MREVGLIPHPEVKITLLSWNEKYLVKMELGPFEQTYKISEMDVTGDEDIKRMLDETFIAEALQHFQAMAKSWMETRRRNEF